MSESFKDAITEADFKLFLVLWNQAQGFTTPDIHLRMAAWLEQSWKKGDHRLLMMAFRSSGKSTLCAVFSAWLLYKNPSLRIMVLAADYALAKKMVRNTRRILERHPLTPHLLPKKPDQWAGDYFTVKRMIELRDPSMLARGITSNITGSRADIIICDDVEVPNTCDTAEKRAELKQRLLEVSYVLVPGGMQIYVGTPHTYYTIYAKEPRLEIGEETAFLDGFKRLEIPLLEASGECSWPERYSDDAIADIQRRSGPNKFSSQMQLRPRNIAEGRLDPSLLQTYKDELFYAKELQTLFLGDKKMISASAWWDPAFGSAKGDHSVLAIIFTDEEHYYLHHLEYIKTAHLQEIDEATQQCRKVADLAKIMMLPMIAVETNGLGKFLPNILRNELAKAKVPCAVQEHVSTRNKDARILEAFDAVMAAQRLFVSSGVLSTAFIDEMQEWRPGSTRGHDDGLDAVAGALALQPVRLRRVYGSGQRSWMTSAKTQKAKTDFEV